MDTRSIIVNLGCGDTPLVGALNVDHRRGQGVDAVVDVYQLPFRDKSITSIYASSVLEHLRDFADALDEIYRVLVHGGTLVASVPYGPESLLNPFHYRAFDESTIGILIRESRDLDRQATRWRLRNMHTRWIPWPLAVFTNILVGKKRELFFTLQAVKE